eukprot:scaffold308284_cov31-Attheya_sp.AAC.1
MELKQTQTCPSEAICMPSKQSHPLCRCQNSVLNEAELFDMPCDWVSNYLEGPSRLRSQVRVVNAGESTDLSLSNESSPYQSR